MMVYIAVRSTSDHSKRSSCFFLSFYPSRSKIDIKLYLQLITFRNRFLLLFQLHHVPRNIDIPSTKPISLLSSQPDNGICRQLRRLGKDEFELLRNVTRSCHLSENVAGMN